MARLFHALVVLGGSLAGCGGQTNSGIGRNDRGSTAKDAGATPTDGVSTAIRSMPTSDHDATVDADGQTNASNTNGVISLDVAPTSSNGGDTLPPLDCPAENWVCEELASCYYESTTTCGAAWNGDITSCPATLRSGDCQCREASSPETCKVSETLTCLYAESTTTDGRTRAGHVACECVPPQPTCEQTCEQHSSGLGSKQRACVATAELVLCGGCIWAGILR
jgi:hypothetical protein